jgi:hypothetical protein
MAACVVWRVALRTFPNIFAAGDNQEAKICCLACASAKKRGCGLPQKIVCSECGSILYNGVELETPSEIIQRHNGVCPQCKKKLEFESEKIKIIPNEEHSKQT